MLREQPLEATGHAPRLSTARASDRALLRATFGRFASGVTVVTCAPNGEVHGMTANSFISVSLNPARALVSISRAARMHTLLQQSELFGLSVLSSEQADVSTHFSGRSLPQFRPSFEERAGVPIIAGSIAWMICRRSRIVDIDDHSLFIGELIDCDHDPSAGPLVFFGGRYGELAN